MFCVLLNSQYLEQHLDAHVFFVKGMGEWMDSLPHRYCPVQASSQLVCSGFFSEVYVLSP